MIMQWKLQTNSYKVFGMTNTIFCYFLQCTDIALIIKCDFQKWQIMINPIVAKIIHESCLVKMSIWEYACK